MIFLFLFFIHFKLELLTQFPASNDENISIYGKLTLEFDVRRRQIKTSKMHPGRVGKIGIQMKRKELTKTFIKKFKNTFYKNISAL